MMASKQTKGISRYLLLFYGAECGLKSIWLRQHGYRKTSQIPDQTLLSQDGHNLSRWISEVGVYSNTVGDPPNFRLARGGSSLDIEKAHQAWRYGIRMRSEDEKVVVEWLETVCDWIKENIE
ncbi:MAG: hypothetical protein AB4352_02545 [Hormoscilla sp.]